MCPLFVDSCTCSLIGSYVVSPDIYWYETIYGKSLHKRTNQRSNHYMLRGVTGNTTYLGFNCFLSLVHLGLKLSRPQTFASWTKRDTKL